MAQLITLTIDDREVTVPAGTTVLDAARSVGIEIPTFCNYAKLVAVGACRMCLVQIEKVRGFPTACTTPVRQDMVVRTDTPEVRKAQRGSLEFLLTNHPLDCPVCDKGGECELQDQVFRFGPGVSRFIEEKRRKKKVYDLSPFIVLDQERCVLCRRCVRFLHEWVGDPQLGVFERGRNSVIDTFPGQPFDSHLSGNVVDLCPVGALTSRVFRFRARVWELTNTPSICPLCGAGCNVTLGVKADRLRRITPRPNEHVNDQWLCDKGRFGHAFVDSPHRLTTPLVRRDGTLQPASWDEALATVAGRLKAIVADYGPDSVGGIGSPRTTNEANYLFQRFMRAVVGTNNVDHLGRMPGAAIPLDLRPAAAVLLVNVHPNEEAPIAELLLRRATLRGQTTVMAMGPRREPLARYGGPVLAYRPGTEVAVLNGLAHVILAAGLERTERPGDVVEGLRRQLRDYSPDRVEELTGVPAAALAEVAETLAGAEDALVVYGDPLAHVPGGVAALDNLTILLGELVPYYLAAHNNTVGALDMGVAPHLYPGRVPLDDTAYRDRLSQRWGVRLLPSTGGSLSEMLHTAEQGVLKALYVVGADPATDCRVGRAALDAVELLVVQDMFLTETARMADVVLPAASFAETEGTYTNASGRVQRLRAGMRCRGQSRPDWRIVADLAGALGHDFGFGSAEAVMAEIAEVVSLYEGLTYQALGDGGARRPDAPRPARELVEVDYQPPPPDPTYPLLMLTGRLLYDRGTLLSQSEVVQRVVPAAGVEMNAADAGPLGIADGDVVTVSSVHGAVELPARVNGAVPPGAVFVPQNLGVSLCALLGDEPAAVVRVKVSK